MIEHTLLADAHVSSHGIPVHLGLLGKAGEETENELDVGRAHGLAIDGGRAGVVGIAAAGSARGLGSSRHLGDLSFWCALVS